MSSASPQHPHSVIGRTALDCAEIRDKHSSQTGTRPAPTSGPPQARQSAGKTVVTTSPTAVRTHISGLRKARSLARHPTTLPGGPPADPSSALSFQHWLKTHLTRRRSRSLGPRHACSISPPPPSTPIISRQQTRSRRYTSPHAKPHLCLRPSPCSDLRPNLRTRTNSADRYHLVPHQQVRQAPRRPHVLPPLQRSLRRAPSPDQRLPAHPDHLRHHRRRPRPRPARHLVQRLLKHSRRLPLPHPRQRPTRRLLRPGPAQHLSNLPPRRRQNHQARTRSRRRPEVAPRPRQHLLQTRQAPHRPRLTTHHHLSHRDHPSHRT